MKVAPLYCANCGAPVGKDAKFCSQCGSPIVIEDDVNRSEHTYREIDEARIKEASVEEKVQLKKLELQLEKEKQKTQRDQLWYKVYPIIVLIGCATFIAFFYMMTHL